MTPLRRLLLILVPVLVLIRCSSGPTVAGSGSESPNAINGTVYVPTNGVSPSLSPADSAQAVLFEIIPSMVNGRIEFSWRAADTAVTDEKGSYAFEDMKEGTYSLLFEKETFKAFSGYFVYTSFDSILLLNIALAKTQDIRGTLSDTSAAMRGGFNLGLVGTPYFDTIPAGIDSFAFAGIPKGIYNWKIESSGKVTNSVLPTFPMFGFTVVLSDRANSSMFSWSAGNDTLYSSCATDTLTVQAAADTVAFRDGNFLINYTVINNP